MTKDSHNIHFANPQPHLDNIRNPQIFENQNFSIYDKLTR